MAAAIAFLNRTTGMSLDPKLWTADDLTAYMDLLREPLADDSWKASLAQIKSDLPRWNAILNDSASDEDPYRVKHAELVRRALIRSPKSIRPTVTAFSDWVFGLYESQYNAQKLQQHQALERAVVAKRIPKPEHPKWTLEYDGTSLSDMPALPIAELTVGGKVLYGKPDLVFRERKTGRVIVLEIKVSNAAVPTNGWPNLRAQLWAYSKFDWNASEVLLAAEVWALSRNTHRRETLVWSSSDVVLERESRELFDIYCAHANSGGKGTQQTDE